MGRVRLSEYTTFGIGGEADAVEVFSRRELTDCGLGAVVIGGGSNVLVSDRGLERVVINRTRSMSFDGEYVSADSGVSLCTLAAEAARRNLSGLEWALGIPGTLGGAIKMNAGAYGGCIADVIRSVSVLRAHAVADLHVDNCGFGYRTSGFLPGDVIVGAVLKLKRADGDDIRAAMRGYSARRTCSQPKGRSAGSVFKAANKPAGYYLERVGLKGERVGSAAVSERHANFIINTGGATASDVKQLMDVMQRRVYESFGVELVPEIILLGEF